MDDIIIKKANKYQVRDLKQAAEIISDIFSKDIYTSPYTAFEIIKSYCNKNDFPVTFLAKRKDEIIGFGCLITNNSYLRQDISPLITFLYVKPKYRNNKIGSKIVNEILKIAKTKFDKVYVLSSIKGFYEKNGFKFVEVTNSHINRQRDIIETRRLYVYNFRGVL